MTIQKITIGDIPTILWGDTSNHLFFYVHGQGGNKEEASLLAEIVCRKGWQVLSFDLPEHGERTDEINTFDPWHTTPELRAIMGYAKEHWEQISLYASSIGAWFSMLCFGNEQFEKCLFVSPVLDMKQLISKMMIWADVTEEQLKSELIIPTSFGQTLSWEYWRYVIEHPILKWDTPTKILYGENDNLIDRNSIEQFSRKFHCRLSLVENGEHWFHTEKQLFILKNWIVNNTISPMGRERYDR